MSSHNGPHLSPDPPIKASVDIEAKPPEILSKLAWLRKNWRRYWALTLVGFLFLVVGWLVATPSGLIVLQYFTNLLVESKIRGRVSDLRLHFVQARDALPQAGPGRFGDVEKDIDTILKLDPRNGHALYYAGEAKRIKNPSLFTQKGCIIAEKLGSSDETLDAYQNDFDRYLDIEKTFSDGDARGDYSAEACYMSTAGYCRQRTAWVNHLLANDLYAEAMVSADGNVKLEKLSRALSHAQTAAKMYREPSQEEGFRQCKATRVLIAEATQALRATK